MIYIRYQCCQAVWCVLNSLIFASLSSCKSVLLVVSRGSLSDRFFDSDSFWANTNRGGNKERSDDAETSSLPSCGTVHRHC
ncbi:uncharacterized protein EDB93DRAFT_802237 [Suillus bovinus]|uniref:uncharacterized protein n=1 Tax=Suillus bovinus TaxID=48563 RepID=UPI001B86CF2E|nr:uncharacterized protein EDB93DRAFT_802237 [Suillus bovinus]KAG2157607.1 hypothetical protein EDB93DRAFT_802237 [Suillus bovinus]